MKTLRITLTTLAVAQIATHVVSFIRARREQVFRRAAGESCYEQFHPRQNHGLSRR